METFVGILLSLVTLQGWGAGKGALPASSFCVSWVCAHRPHLGCGSRGNMLILRPRSPVTSAMKVFLVRLCSPLTPHTIPRGACRGFPGTHPCADAPLCGQLLSLSLGPWNLRELPVRVGEHPMSKNEGVEGKGSAHSVSLWDLSSSVHSGTVAHKSPASLSFLPAGPHCPTLPPLSPGIASQSDLQRLFQKSPELGE